MIQIGERRENPLSEKDKKMWKKMVITNPTRNIQLEKTTAILKANTVVLIPDVYIFRDCRGMIDTPLSGRILHSELCLPWIE